MEVEIPELTCLRCGVRWNPRVPRPKKCPYCQSLKWDISPNDEKAEVGTD